MTGRALIVNGDDFGLTPGVNRGIVDAHLHGILTSASLFANGAATGEAIELARRTPTLGIGVHLVLVDGTPVLPASQLPTLAPGGTFRNTWVGFARAALARRIRLAEVEAELTAQIERLHAAGLTLTHLDGHKHVHAYPPVFDIIVRLARRFGISSIRVPCERRPFALAARWCATPGARRQAGENLALLPWARRDCRLLAANHLLPPPQFLGRALTGVFTRERLIELLRSVPAGVSELMTHPGYPDAGLESIRTRLRAERATEVALLTDPEVLATVDRERLRLVRHDGHPVERHAHASTR